jgi:hypothetical protein
MHMAIDIERDRQTDTHTHTHTAHICVDVSVRLCLCHCTTVLSTLRAGARQGGGDSKRAGRRSTPAARGRRGNSQQCARVRPCCSQADRQNRHSVCMSVCMAERERETETHTHTKAAAFMHGASHTTPMADVGCVVAGVCPARRSARRRRACPRATLTDPASQLRLAAPVPSHPHADRPPCVCARVCVCVCVRYAFVSCLYVCVCVSVVLITTVWGAR